jgi:quercetin dioxygenase-like cupin family protein
MKTNPGARIVSIRNTYNISREALAQQSSVPLELLQKIEEEGYIPELSPLVKIARALGVRLGTLLDDENELGPVITRKGTAPQVLRVLAQKQTEQDHRFVEGDSSLIFKSLAMNKTGRHMEPFLITVLPDRIPRSSSHEGEEFLYIISGRLRLEYGTQVYELEEGDSIYYDSLVPHRLIALDNQAVEIIAVVYTPI